MLQRRQIRRTLPENHPVLYCSRGFRYVHLYHRQTTEDIMILCSFHGISRDQSGSLLPYATVIEPPVRGAVAVDAEGDRVFQGRGVVAPVKVEGKSVPI